MSWTEEGDISYNFPESKIKHDAVAIFNINAVITSDSGRSSIKNKSDIVFSLPNTDEVLNELSKKFTVLIIDDKDNTDYCDWILKRLSFEPYMVSSIRSIKSMWKLFLSKTRITPNSASFYCGANGKGVSTRVNYVSTNSDVKAAKELELAYYDPEDLFSTVTPESVIESLADNKAKQYLIITTGKQGSGKSTFTRALSKLLPKSTIITRSKKIVSEIETALDEKKTVLVDATNPKVENRQQLIDIAIERKIPAIVLLFNRDGTPFNEERTGDERIHKVALNKYSSDYEKPKKKVEKYTDLYRIN